MRQFRTTAIALIVFAFIALVAPSLAAPTVASVRPDGTLTLDGEPFFALGMYHVSWAGTDQQRSQALADMAAAGFNFIHPSLDAGDTAFLDEASSYGMMVQAEFNQDWNQVVAAHKDHPAMMGWNIGDDVSLHTTPSVLQAFHDAVKAADPNHVTSIGAFAPDHFSQFLPIPDCPGVYSYPVPAEDLIVVGETFKRAREHSNSLWGVPQAFAWSGQRPPTREELRNMAYQMVIYGAKGLLYYTYYDGGDDLPDAHPALWAELTEMNAECKQLAKALTDGQRTVIASTGAYTIRAAEWVEGAWGYLIVVNASQTTTYNASIDLPSGADAALTPCFAGRPSGLTNSGGHVTGSIGPVETHVYRYALGPIPSTSFVIK